MIKAFAALEPKGELRPFERRLRNILDNTQDMIFIFAPDTLRFVYVNKGAISSIGYSREELLQMSALDALPLIPEPEC
ncbi:MAG: PAS domain S-box protein, partial [Gallionella sp.]